MSIEVMKQALEALESCTPADTSTGHVVWPSYDEQAVEQAITALRQALANEALDRMAENARELGLDYDAKPDERLMKMPDEPVAICEYCEKERPVIHAPQPADEPVAWLVRWNDDGAERTSVRLTKPDGEWSMDRLLPLYTRPLNSVNSIKSSNTLDAQPAAWVGLTDEEMRELEKQFNAERVRTSDEEYLIIYPGDYWQWQRAIEQALKEKNHG